MNNNQKYQIAKISILVTSMFVIFLSVTYAFINLVISGTRRQEITAGTLDLVLFEDENRLIITDALPMHDEVGMIQEPFTFQLVNRTDIDTNYILKLEEIAVENPIVKEDVRYGITKNGISKIDFVSNLTDGVIDGGVLVGRGKHEYALRLWIRDTLEDSMAIDGKSLKYKLKLFVYKDVTDVFQIRYENLEHTSCGDIECALNELYEKFTDGD